jgi:hypothetical protein
MSEWAIVIFYALGLATGLFIGWRAWRLPSLCPARLDPVRCESRDGYCARCHQGMYP